MDECKPLLTGHDETLLFIIVGVYAISVLIMAGC